MACRCLPLLRLIGALLPLVTGCVRRPVATCPDEGGHEWREVRSPHFRISTDLGTRVARLTAVELEQLRGALLLAWGGQVDPPGQVEVIVARSSLELEEFTQGAPLEAFMDSSGRSPLMVMAGEGRFLVESPENLEVQAHELTHHIGRSVMVRQPRWLSEGLATYLQTLRFSSLRRKATFLRFRFDYYAYLRRHGRLGMSQLWVWDGQPYLSAGEALPYYMSSWLWVLFLTDKHPSRFRDFQERLTRAEEPRHAWEEAFRDVPRLEEDFQAYAPDPEGQLTVELPRVQPELEERELDCAEVHTLRARLFLRSPGQRRVSERLRLAREEIARALREDPASVGAVQLQADFTPDPVQRLALARALLQARPASGPAWRLLGQALQDSGAPVAEQEQALQRALELEPEDVDALVAMAWLHTEKGETEQGLAKAARAVQLAPGRASTLEAYAALLFQAGHCLESLTAQQRALGVLDGHVTQSLRNAAQAAQLAMRQKLAEYEQHCASTQSR